MADPSIILDIEPDWDDNPVVTYSFLNALQDTPYFVEQRRPLYPSVNRMLSCKFTESNSKLQRLRNTLLAAKAELLCVPLFSEPIAAASIVTGGSAITASTDLTYLWNIKNCSYAVLIDYATGQSEMLGIASVAGQLIRFSTNIVKTWVAAQTVIYPAIAASLKAVKESNILNKTASIDAEFEEMVLGEEAISEWVGVEDTTCCELLVTPEGYENFLTDWVWSQSPPIITVTAHEALMTQHYIYSSSGVAILTIATRTFNNFDIIFGVEVLSITGPIWPDTAYNFIGFAIANNVSPPNWAEVRIGTNGANGCSFGLYMYSGTTALSAICTTPHTVFPVKRNFRFYREGTTCYLKIFNNAILEETLSLTHAQFTHTDLNGMQMQALFQTQTNPVCAASFYFRNVLVIKS